MNWFFALTKKAEEIPKISSSCTVVIVKKDALSIVFHIPKQQYIICNSE